MRYTVRTKEGELKFGSFGEVEKAWLLGLVEPDDEVLEEGHEKWRKASSFPLLLRARRTGEQAWGGSWFLWTMIGICLGSAALWLIKSQQYLYGGILGVGTALVMAHVTTQAHKRSKPHG
jgi:hypothetical protein